MNSGGVVIATTAVEGAAAAVTVATVASAAVLVVRTVNAVAQFAARTKHIAHVGNPSGKCALFPLDSTAGSTAEGGAAAEEGEPERQWDSVAAQVVIVNARIRMLGERIDRAVGAGCGAAGEPVRLEGLTVADVARRAVRAAELLADDQAAARAAIAADERREVTALLPHSIASRHDIAARLANFQRILSRRAGSTHQGPDRPPSTGGESGGETAPGIDAEIEELLLALDQDANAWEHREVLGAAARVVRDGSPEARVQLGVLRGKVDAVNEAVGRRRLAACWLSALEEPAIAVVEPPGPLHGVARRLRKIVAGEEELTAESRAQAAEAVEWAAGVARLRFVRDVMSECLAGQGYVVDGEFDPENSDELRLTRTEWQGQHSVEIWLDRYGAVHGRLVRETHAPREHRGAGDENGSDMVEHERIARFNADLELLGRRLHSAAVPESGYVPRDDAANARAPLAVPGQGSSLC